MNDFITAAQDLVYIDGVEVTYREVQEGTYNPSTGSVTNTEVETVLTSYPKNVIATAYNYPNLVDREVVEFLIVAIDLATKPKQQDKIVRDSVVYSVERVRETVAEGVPVLYKALAVKG